MDNLFRNHSKKIFFILATTTIIDPFEKNTAKTQLPSIPVDAIVTDLSPTSAEWKMPGISISKAKEIMIEKKQEDLLRLTHIIEIDGEKYHGWMKNGKLSYRINGNYLFAYIFIEKV